MLEVKELSNKSQEGRRLMEKIFSLRYDVYSRLGWILDKRGTSKMVKDQFDNIPLTTHFAILENNDVKGAVRMTKYSSKYKLPLIKNGISSKTFQKKSFNKISEGTRLVVKQDKKYPGCALQLLYFSHNYILSNGSKFICGIGNPDNLGLFKYIGHKKVNQEIDCKLDGKNGRKITRPGTPILLDRLHLNRDIKFSKYNIKRQMMVIKSG